MTNTKEAAERLRLAFDNDELSADLDELFDMDSDIQISRDLFAVARAYVAEHLPDDDVLIDSAYWRTVATEGLLSVNGCILELNWGRLFINNLCIFKDPTRGQLRRLIAALTDKRGEP